MAMTTPKDMEQELLKIEQGYWYNIVYKNINNRADFRYPDDATKGLLKGKFNQDHISSDLEWPVLRWRQLRDLIAQLSPKEIMKEIE